MSAWTKQNLAAIDDVAPGHGMGDILEGHFARGALELKKVGISHQVIKPGKRLPFGHTHAQQEEVYVVLAGSGTMKVEDDLVTLDARLDALRVAAGTWRGVEAGPDGLELLAFGGPVGGEDDADMEMGWWPEEES